MGLLQNICNVYYGLSFSLFPSCLREIVPLISVLLPVFNNANELPRALNGLLCQTSTDFEIIAVNDGSTDSSGELLEEFATRDPRIRVFHQKNGGLADALNFAAGQANGEFFARHDADDVSARNRFKRQLAAFRENRNLVLCGTWSCFVHPETGPEAYCAVPNDSAILKRLLWSGSNPISHGSVMFKRATFESCPGGYRFRTGQDYDLWLRMSSLGDLGIVESIQYFYWMSSSSISSLKFDSRAMKSRAMLELNKGDLASTPSEIDRIETKGTKQVVPGELGLYQRGIFRLLNGDRTGYYSSMMQVAAMNGILKHKAELHLRFRFAFAALRFWYIVKLRNTQMRYLKPFDRSCQMPEWELFPSCLRVGGSGRGNCGMKLDSGEGQ